MDSVFTECLPLSFKIVRKKQAFLFPRSGDLLKDFFLVSQVGTVDYMLHSARNSDLSKGDEDVKMCHKGGKIQDNCDSGRKLLDSNENQESHMKIERVGKFGGETRRVVANQETAVCDSVSRFLSTNPLDIFIETSGHFPAVCANRTRWGFIIIFSWP